MSDEFLSSVRNGIGSALISDENPDPILSEIARYAAVEGRGKLARPRLVQAFARAAGLDVDRTKTISVATELIHVASLLHDDIVDHAEQRRGMTAANRIWGNAATVLGGDFVLCRALIALQGTPSAVGPGDSRHRRNDRGCRRRSIGARGGPNGKPLRSGPEQTRLCR